MTDVALLVVDMQPDFMPGGALPVERGDTLVEPIGRLVREGEYALRVGTQDWHPGDHVSFASNHEGHEPFDVIRVYGQEQTLWPDHCVQGTPGAELHADLPVDALDVILRKGTDRCVDSYSAFRNNWDPAGERPPTGLAGLLREREIRRVDVCGLARDFCVVWSAEDAAGAGFETRVLWDLTLPVDPDSDDDVRRRLEDAGAQIVSGEGDRRG